ncbi:MAG: hypothetical protein Kow0058_01330 [Roseovarius sp.]
MTGKSEEGTSRRDFLKLAASGAPAIAVIAATGEAAAATDAPEAASGRIQDTAHTRAYYDSARF